MDKTELESLIEKAQKAFLDYSEFSLAKAQVGEEQALEAIRTKLSSAKWADAAFVKKATEENAFSLSACYIPVYRVVGDAEYKWVETTKGDAQNGVPVKEALELHAERHIEKIYSRIPAELNAENIAETLPQTEEQLETIYPSLYLDADIPYKTNEKRLKQLAADYSPDSKAQITLNNAHIEVVFIPALVAEIVWKERKYTSFVNLHNGGCLTAYPFSDKLSDKKGKAARQLYASRLCSCFALLFILSYAAIALKNYIEKSGTFNLGITGGLFALALMPLFSVGYSFGQKHRLSQNFENCATTHGRLPGMFLAILFAILSWVAAAVAFVLFAAR